jgi:hypothetical protein
MVLHVLADAAQFVQAGDADPAEIADTGQLQVCGEPTAPAERITSRPASARSTGPGGPPRAKIRRRSHACRRTGCGGPAPS